MAFTKEQKRAYRRTSQYEEGQRKYELSSKRRECRAAREKREDVKTHRWAYRHSRKYGISVEGRIQMIEDQDGRCKICNEKLDMGRNTHIDHCHTTGKVRGILCRSCNLGLGNFKDSVDNLAKAVQYLHQSG